jgi:hypothetical protein
MRRRNMAHDLAVSEAETPFRAALELADAADRGEVQFCTFMVPNVIAELVIAALRRVGRYACDSEAWASALRRALTDEEDQS